MGTPKFRGPAHGTTLCKNLKKLIISKIFEKKEQALAKKVVLEENGSALKEECETLESDLEISVKEEEVLTLEYAQLINKVEGSIVLSDDIDMILFSSLTNVDE